ncbi:pimeloyl-ACP methyl ester esterase BioH [Thermithiobacillus plumbiphilus]|uniref:Pimeloyl-[acyl-carrier protein] methyl ester esterase n=1 Tax=Thermithiobacillus plumbiphilus TaxID=1729899 RepID=A0ABU9D9S6_9PROT
MRPESWAYSQHGQGPDLVCLHGWGTQGDIFIPLVDELVQGFRVTTLDLPGHGHTPCGAGLDLDRAAARLGTILETLAGPKPWLLGWSLGGMIALDLARQSPDSLTGLVLISTTPRFVAGPNWAAGMEAAAFQQFAHNLLDDPQATVKRFLALQTLDDGEGRRALRQLQQGSPWPTPDPDCLAGGLDILREIDLRPALDQMRLPVLLIQGGRDRVVLPQAAEYLAERLPDSRLLNLPRAGHAPFLTAPAECAQAIRRFLDER